MGCFDHDLYKAMYCVVCNKVFMMYNPVALCLQCVHVKVMQFGRIDSNAYTLDFEHPFTAVQAFAVALANVTQRLK